VSGVSRRPLIPMKPPLKKVSIYGGIYDVCSLCERSPGYCTCSETIVEVETELGAFLVCGLCGHSPDFCNCRPPVVVNEHAVAENAARALEERRRAERQQEEQNAEWEARVMKRRREFASKR